MGKRFFCLWACMLFLYPCFIASGQALGMEEVVQALKAELQWEPLSRIGALVLKGHRLVFQASLSKGSSSSILDGQEIVSLPSPYLVDGILYFPQEFVEGAGSALERAQEQDATSFSIAAIVIDPGHGGKDSGAVDEHQVGKEKLKLVEKDITLSVSLDLYTKLSLAYPQKKVLLTRDSDSYPSLEDRVEMAHSIPLKTNEAVLFISIHANASFNKKARGYEVWYLSPEYRRTLIDQKEASDSAEVLPILNAMLEEEYTTESIMIARSILNRLDQVVGAQSPSRGLKAEEWFVVRNAKMPSVLVELGFVTNKEDAILLSDPLYLRKLSEALYKGTEDFISTFERSGGFTTLR